MGGQGGVDSAIITDCPFCRATGVQYDLKQSSYKKLGKLLDKFEKDKVG